MKRTQWSWQDGCVALSITLLTAVLYIPAGGFDFVNYDDPLYVSNNFQVKDGLTAHGIKWAFTTGHASNWHPLTWLSLMLDAQLLGSKPGGFHLINVLLHALNALLLFVCLRRFGGTTWPSAFIAGLFAWHPMHVESVAWISERKDVLSGLFFILGLLGYQAYTRRCGKPRSNAAPFYILTLFVFACGLMAKPMLVTFPFVLLLLDFWPLRRISHFTLGPEPELAELSALAGKVTLAKGLLEKLPFLGLAIVSSVITYLAQSRGGSIYQDESLGIGSRLANAVVSYARYTVKLVWPGELHAPYLVPDQWPWLTVFAATIFVIALTGIILSSRKRQGAAVVGWLLFLGMLVPVIGLVQVGMQAMADRYTYIPAVGFFICCSSVVAALASKLRLKAPVMIVAASLVLIACWWSASRQLAYWKNTVTLFEHTLAVDPLNFRALFNLGDALVAEGRLDAGLARLEQAAAQKPNYAAVQARIAQALAEQGRTTEAIARYRQALALDPDLAEALNNLCWILATTGDASLRNGVEAVALGERACRLTRDGVPVFVGTLAAAYAEAGRFSEATQKAELARTLALESGNTAIANANARLAELYRANQAYHTVPTTTNSPAR